MEIEFQEQGLHMRLLPSSMFAPINEPDAFTVRFTHDSPNANLDVEADIDFGGGPL